MTTPSLLDLAERPEPVYTTPKKTNLARVVEYFQARPNQWIDGMVFRSFAGGYGGWSARIRQAKKRYGMHIENRQTRRADGSVLSEYCWVPSERGE